MLIRVFMGLNEWHVTQEIAQLGVGSCTRIFIRRIIYNFQSEMQQREMQ